MNWGSPRDRGENRHNFGRSARSCCCPPPCPAWLMAPHRYLRPDSPGGSTGRVPRSLCSASRSRALEGSGRDRGQHPEIVIVPIAKTELVRAVWLALVVDLDPGQLLIGQLIAANVAHIHPDAEMKRRIVRTDAYPARMLPAPLCQKLSGLLLELPPEVSLDSFAHALREFRPVGFGPCLKRAARPLVLRTGCEVGHPVRELRASLLTRISVSGNPCRPLRAVIGRQRVNKTDDSRQRPGAGSAPARCGPRRGGSRAGSPAGRPAPVHPRQPMAGQSGSVRRGTGL